MFFGSDEMDPEKEPFHLLSRSATPSVAPAAAGGGEGGAAAPNDDDDDDDDVEIM